MQPKTKTIIFIVVSFLLGAVGGGYVGKMYFSDSRGHGSQPSREQVRQEFASKLKLDPTQAAQVDSIIEVFRQGFNETRKQYTETFKMRRDSLRKDIRRLLSAEQNKLYDEYIKELDERESKNRKGEK